MNRYERYKDSGIPWLGEVPEHWKTLSIKRLSQVKRGASPRPIDNPDYFDDDGEYAWVRIADVTASNMYLLETTQRLSDLGKSFSVPLQPNSLFLSIAGSVGKPIITKIKACIHDGFVYFPEYKHNMKFLYYIFSSGQPYLGLGKMGTQLNLNTDTVGAIKIALPSPKEQTAIAHYLDTKLGEIDALIDKQQTLLEKLAEQRTAVITHAVTKGLNPAAPMKNSGVEWLGDMPAHWDVKRLKFLITELRVGPFGSAIKISDYVQDGKPLYNQRTVLDNSFVNNSIFITDEKYKELNSFQTKSGDFLLTTRGTIGKVAIVPENAEPGIIHPCLIRFKIDENLVLPKLLKSIFNETDFFKKQLDLQSNATTIDVIYSNSLKELFLALPPRDEQTAITDYLDQETAKIDRLCETVNQTIDRLKEYRTALITQAVTGKIKVTDE